MSRLDRYQDPELYDRLAAEYVLGTLQGRARQRFVRLMDERPYIEAAVSEWQDRLDPLGERVPELQPPSRVWRGIDREIRASGRSARQTEVRSSAKPGFWQSLAFWQFSTVAAVALLVVSVLVPVQRPGEPPMPQYVSVLEAPDNGPMMVATGTGKPWTLTVALVDGVDGKEMPDDKQMRLWCYHKDGRKPIPMGIVTTDKYTVFTLTQEQWEGLAQMSHLGISVEPMGSDQDEPMGPVMYKG
ncbi:MAG: anti-sigma factor, partial [Thiohalocapsa sp.]